MNLMSLIVIKKTETKIKTMSQALFSYAALNTGLSFPLVDAICLKVVPATFLLVCFLSLNKGTCETRKNAFYFILKALVLEKIKF